MSAPILPSSTQVAKNSPNLQQHFQTRKLRDLSPSGNHMITTCAKWRAMVMAGMLLSRCFCDIGIFQTSTRRVPSSSDFHVGQENEHDDYRHLGTVRDHYRPGVLYAPNMGNCNLGVLLSTFNPGILRNSQPVSGPKWKFPNGLIIERFINGRLSSEKWREYGPVYRLWSGLRPEIVITTPKDFKNFSSDANDHGKPHNMNLGWFIGESLGQCLGFHNGQSWMRMRNVFGPTFTHSAAVACLDMVHEGAKAYVDKLPQLAANPSFNTDGRVPFLLSVADGFTKIPYFLTARVIYGAMTATEEDELWRITQIRSSLTPYFFIGIPYRSALATRLFDRGAIARLREFEREWTDFHRTIVHKRRAEGGPRPPILGYWEEFESGNITLPELLQTIDELLILNLDVITHVISWCISLVAEHEAVKHELCEEITAHQDDLPAYIAKSDTHLHRCLAESMRIQPFTIFTPGEYSNQVKNFDGILVKPGVRPLLLFHASPTLTHPSPKTQILLDVLAINVRNPYWGSDSTFFRPSRFIGLKPSELRYNVHNFGIGSRKCMGQYVGMHIVKALVVNLFDTYEVKLADESEIKVDKSGWTPKAGGFLKLARK
uniref:Cytochrome P450 n=1 Tax=Phyllosticta cirsii TaxID=1986016 RepID=A0A1X9PXY5_9PEZI|nr:cytochrome P450 [Phyllosticta cirsii]